jgi:predicted acyl esterase
VRVRAGPPLSGTAAVDGRLRAGSLALPALLLLGLAAAAPAQTPAGPVFVDGQAQLVPAFQDSTQWIRHDLWVETEFDSDGDGRRDRVHVGVVRPRQTDTEGLRVAVIYETSPYYSGTGSPDRRYFWDVRHELGEPPPPRNAMPPIDHQSRRPRISSAHVNTWVPRAFAVVDSQSPGTGLSQGCPTVGGENEALAPKAVIDWLNGRARGFTTPDGDEQVTAYWATGSVGMIGTSYNGTLPIAAATTGVAGLDAIVPIAPNTSYYHYYRARGLIRGPGGWLGEDIDVLFDFINSGDPARRAYCTRTVRDGEMAAGMDRITGDYNDFWAGRNYRYAADRIRAATLMGMGGLAMTRQPGQGQETLVDNVSFGGPTLAKAEWTDHRPLYATAPLAEAVHVSGTPRITVRLAADRPAVNLSVWLVSLPWTDSDTLTNDLITRGWADARNHADLRRSEALEPGRFYTVTFDLEPDDQVVRAGQRVGLMLFSSGREFTLWPRPGARLTFDLDATSLVLPVVGGSATLARALAPPAGGPD